MKKIICVLMLLSMTGCFNFVSVMSNVTGTVLFGPPNVDFNNEKELRELLKKDRNAVFQAMGKKHMDKMTDDQIVALAKKLDMLKE